LILFFYRVAAYDRAGFSFAATHRKTAINKKGFPTSFS
jgi:hypothetical protein